MGEIGVPPALTDAVGSIKDAVNAGRTDIFRKLLEACEKCEGGGVEERKQLVNSLATNQGTFLHMATKLGHSDIVRALLASGADPGIIDRNGNTPIEICPSPSVLSVFMEDLLRATAKSEIGRVCQLIASGMNVNAYDNPLSKNTPLHWAASFADLDTLNCLIARGASVNSRNSDGATPLHDAIARGEPTLVEALLEQGADLHIKCHKGPHKGKTAYDMTKGNAVLRTILEKYLSDPSPYASNALNGVSNGSVSPVLGRKSLQDRGSAESLVSVGTDSVMTSSSPKSKLLRGQSLTSVEETVNNVPICNGVGRRSIARSPLQSTSSLELTPNMEQVCERLAAMQVTMPPRPLVTNSALHRLWPQPKRITELIGSPWKVPRVVTLSISHGPVPVHQVVDVWSIHKPWLREVECEVELNCVLGARGRSQPNDAALECVVDPALMISSSHYSIAVEERGVRVICGSLHSLHHALVTFAQLLRVFGAEHRRERTSTAPMEVYIPPLVLVDYPSIPNRGFMMDMSPVARIPTLERVCQIIDTLVSLKINQLHLLFKIIPMIKNSNFLGSPYSTRETDGICSCHLPFTASELVSLERYCADRGMSLTPAFDLESSGGTCSRLRASDISAAISEALANLPLVKYVHIGPGLTALFADGGKASPSSWSQLQIPDDAVMTVCANVFHNNPSALEALPLSCILVEYGFQADYDFSSGCSIALEKGRPLAVCPGTSAWSSLSGWPEAGVSNVYSGVVSSLESGASSIIVAHWSNTACLTPLVFTWPPLLVAAGLSWNHTTHWDFVHSSVGSLIDEHIVKVAQCGLGDALIELGRCETWLTRVARDQPSNDPSDLPSCDGSTLHQILTDPDSVNVDHLSPDVFASVMRHVRKAVKEGCEGWKESNANKAPMAGVSTHSPWPMAPLAILELHLAMDMILTACRLGRALVTVGTNPRSNMGMAVVNPGVANLPPTLRTDIANKVLALREVYSSVWLQGHRPNGLHSSLLVFSSLLSRLIPEQTVHGV